MMMISALTEHDANSTLKYILCFDFHFLAIQKVEVKACVN